MSFNKPIAGGANFGNAFDLSSLKKLFIQLSTNETKKTTNYLPLQDNYLTAISAAK